MVRFILVCLFFAASGMLCAADTMFPLRGLSYMQRGILKYGGNDIALTVYVVCADGKVNAVVESQSGMLAKVCISQKDGAEISCEGGTLFPERLARRIVMRDILAVLGYNAYGGSRAVYFRKSNGRLDSLSSDGYAVEFSDYRKIGSADIPFKIKIKNSDYNLSLYFVSLINKK